MRELKVGDRAIQSGDGLCRGESPEVTITGIRGGIACHTHDSGETGSDVVERFRLTDLLSRIQAIDENTTLGELDNIEKEIGDDYSIQTYSGYFSLFAGYKSTKIMANFHIDFTDNTSKLKARKNVYLWLYNHSNKNAEKKKELEELISAQQSRVNHHQIELNDLKDQLGAL